MAEMSFTINPENRSIVVVVRGRASLSECVRMVDDLTSSPGYDPAFRVLGDIRGIEFAPSAAEAEALSRLFLAKQEYYGNGLGVLVAGTLHFGLTRMINLFAGDQHELIVPFIEEAEAFAWLADAGAA